MKTPSSSIKHSLVVGGLLIAVNLSPIALAQNGASNSDSSHSGTNLTSSSTELAESAFTTQTKAEIEAEAETQHKAEVESKQEHQKVKLEAKLDKLKLKSCQDHQQTISGHTNNFTLQAQRQLATFDGISQKVQAFASAKNLTIPDEAALLTQITAAKAKVNQDLATLKTDADAFKCDGPNPKGQLQAFQADAKLIRSDLKVYRSLVRQLIQAVRKANGQTKTTEPATKPVGGN